MDGDRPKPQWGTAFLIVLLGGCVVFFGALFAKGDADATRVFHVIVYGLLVLTAIVLAVQGYREDGVMGAFYRVRFPLGTWMAGDERVNLTPTRLAMAIVLVGAVCAGWWLKFG